MFTKSPPHCSVDHVAFDPKLRALNVDSHVTYSAGILNIVISEIDIFSELVDNLLNNG